MIWVFSKILFLRLFVPEAQFRELDGYMKNGCQHNLKMFLQRQSVSFIRKINRTVSLVNARPFSDASVTIESSQKLGGFAEAFEKHTQTATEDEVKPKRAPLPFATLLKNSKFVDVS